MYALYSIYDRVTMEASQPFVAKNDAHACRIFQATQRDNPNPEDFRLYLLGQLSQDGLVITPESPPREVFGPGGGTLIA